MQQTSVPSEPDFFVDWQLADDSDRLIDLSAAESEVLLPQPASASDHMRSTEPTRR